MFRNRKNTVTGPQPLQDKVAKKLAAVVMKVESLFAHGMSRIFGKMGAGQLKFVLALFCVINGGLSIYFFSSALLARPVQTIKVEPIRLPGYFDKTGTEIMESPVPDEIYQQLQELKRYADSSGTIISQGLRDSIAFLEEYYLKQQ